MRVAGRYLAGPDGPLALVTFAPPPGTPVRARVLHCPAFGDEMNKARHVVAAQARALADGGALVGVLDPRGTGDSGGAFAQATWAGWREDAVCAWQALDALAPGTRAVLWGLRTGALLAADLACTGAIAPGLLLLWQPVASGKGFVGQFLRIAAAQALDADAGGRTREALRAELAAGRMVDVGGYALAPALVAGLEVAAFEALAAPAAKVIVREAGPAEAEATTPATAKWIAAWRAGGAEVDAATVAAPSFWSALELEDAPALVAATTAAVRAAGAVA